MSTTTVRRQQATNDHDRDAVAAARVAKAAQANPDEPPLDWNTFFKLRKTRRRWQLAFSVISSLLGGTSGALVLSTGAAEALVSQVPLDPMITLGLMTFGSAALGWLVGPALGSQVFYATNRKYKKQMTIKETQFFARVKKNRVDPTNSSAGNPGRLLTCGYGFGYKLVTKPYSTRLLRREDLECGWI
jgi:import inner membrane translocase subunit TIM23